MKWKAIVGSVAGSSHKRKGLPCQDYGAFTLLPDGIAIGAIGDGTGASRYAELGSFLATQASVYALKHQDWIVDTMSEQDARTILGKVFGFAQRVVLDAAHQSRTPASEFCSTLLAFVASTNWLAAMQIGDGFNVVRWANSDSYEILFRPQKRGYVNHPYTILDPDAEKDLEIGFWKRQADFICLASDGLESVALSLKDWTAHAPFFEPLDLFARELTDVKQGRSEVLGFLQSPELDARCDDDKTLLLCTRMAGKEARVSCPT